MWWPIGIGAVAGFVAMLWYFIQKAVANVKRKVPGGWLFLAFLAAAAVGIVSAVTAWNTQDVCPVNVPTKPASAKASSLKKGLVRPSQGTGFGDRCVPTLDDRVRRKQPRPWDLSRARPTALGRSPRSIHRAANAGAVQSTAREPRSATAGLTRPTRTRATIAAASGAYAQGFPYCAASAA